MRILLQLLSTLLLLYPVEMLSAGPDKVVYAITPGGSWTNGADWSSTSGGASCSCTPDVSKDDIYIETNITSSTGLIFGASVLIVVRSGNTLTVNGDSQFSNGSIITIEAGASLVINGNLVNNNNSNQVTVNGTLVVNGNFSGGNGSAVLGTGNMTTTGTASTSGTGTVFGSSGTCSPGPCDISPSNPLPVEYLYVNGKLKSQQVIVEWATANEFNNAYFTLERSADGFSFESIAEIPGAGNSSTIKSYFSVDTDPVPGDNYYRIRQTDFNGASAVSHLIVVRNETIPTMNVFPSPSNGIIKVILDGNRESQILVILRDVLGKEYYSKGWVLTSGQLIQSLDFSHLPAGIYCLVASSSDTIIEKKLMIE